VRPSWHNWHVADPWRIVLNRTMPGQDSSLPSEDGPRGSLELLLPKKFLELAPICRLRFGLVLVGVANVPPSQFRFEVEGVWRDSRRVRCPPGLGRGLRHSFVDLVTPSLWKLNERLDVERWRQIGNSANSVSDGLSLQSRYRIRLR